MAEVEKNITEVKAETGEGEGEPGAEPGSGEGQKAVAKPAAETVEGEEPVLIEPTHEGVLAPAVALPVPEPRIFSMPDPVMKTNIKGHKIKRDIKIYSAPSNYDENPPAKTVDMCIIMDCTGSMSAWIKHCKDTLKEVIDESMEEDEGSAVRVAFVGYRDFCDKSIYDVHDFTYLDGEMKSFISKRKAKGGGDAPEDVQGALHQALHLSWMEQSIKLCFFVADAPCHGRQYHSCNDDYGGGNPNGHVLEIQMKEFSDREILFTCYKLTNETEKMYDIMEKSYQEGKEKDGFEFIDIRGQVQGHKPLAHTSSKKKKDPCFSGVADLFGADEDEEEEWEEAKVEYKSAPTTSSGKREVVFGGFGELFLGGDAPEVSHRPVPKKKKSKRDPKCSGVADFFCDDDDEASSPDVTHRPAPKAKKREHSFGGYSSLFGDEDVPPKVAHRPAPKKNSEKNRAATFNGVAALFGDEEAPPPSERPAPKKKLEKNRAATFGGVAALFGEEDAARPAPKKSSAKKRDPTFSGVACLFGADESDDEEFSPSPVSAMYKESTVIRPSAMRSAAPKKRAARAAPAPSSSVNLKSAEIRGAYSASTRENCRRQKNKMRKRKGW